MAGKGKKTFVAGEILIAQDVNEYLMDQTVMNFASSAARSSAIPTPTQGMVSYQKDTDAIEAYDGSNWVTRVSTSVPFATSCGGITVSYSASTAANAAVTFPAGRFTETPIVTISSTTASALSRSSNASVQSVSTSGFTANAFYVLNTNQTGNVVLNWQAIQMTSASAGG